MRRGFLVLLLLAAVLLGSPVPSRTQESEGELLVPGPPLERPMAAGEKHFYRVEVKDDPVLVTVDQRSIDLVLEVHGPAGEELRVGGTGGRWGPEIVLLEGAGERRVEVRPMKKGVWPGRYAIAVEALSDLSTDGSARRQAFSLMSRAAQEAFPETREGRQQAAAHYREALAAWRALEDRRWEAEALSSLALLEYRSRDLNQALADYEPAVALWKDLGEMHREALALNDLGLTRRGTGNNQGAREAYTAAVSLWKQLEAAFDEAEARINLCVLVQAEGAFPEALACYEEPLVMFQKLGVHGEEQRIVNAMGGLYELLGEPDKALAHYQRSLLLARSLGDLREEARTLNNIALLHRVLGEWQEALRLYGQAGEIVDRIGDRSLKAALLLNVGFAYNSLGEPKRAIAHLQEALQMYRDIGDRRSEVITLNSLGSAQSRLGDLDKAFDHFSKALELADTTENLPQQAFARLGLADVQIELGNPLAALSTLDTALSYLKTSGFRVAETQALQARGRALTLAGRSREALPLLKEVIGRRRILRDRAGEAMALVFLAMAERSMGLQEEACSHAEEAVDRVEELRTGFVTPGLRAAFLSTQHSAYSLLIDLLMERHEKEPAGHWNLAALEISEQARARNLVDALQSENVAPVGRAVVPAALLNRRRLLHRRLSVTAYQQLEKGNARAAALGEETESLLAELDAVEAEIGRLEPRAVAFRHPTPISAQEIAGLLDPGTLLLEYSLGRDRSYLWAVSPSGAYSFTLPPEQEIEALAHQVYEELSKVEAGSTNVGSHAEALEKIVLGPVRDKVAQASRLLIVPDGALNYVPFAALPVPAPDRRPLLECAEVVYLPSATTMALSIERLERRPQAPKWAAIFADPVFRLDDPRLARPIAVGRRTPVQELPQRREVTELFPAFERLPYSEREAKGIASLAPAGQVSTSTGFEASREAVFAKELRDYRIIHFATHGIANTSNPELSGLVLSLLDDSGQARDGFVSLKDIYELNLAADLVVLSGCDTAVGREVWGEGLMGLTRAFLYAGAPRVLASLWAVPDRAGAELMTRYYQAMWKDSLAPAAALRHAQISLRRDPRYRGSYAWAGFVLQGDWR